MSHTDEDDTAADPCARDVLRVAALRAELALDAGLEPCGAAVRTLREPAAQDLRADPWLARHAPLLLERLNNETE